jgi:co-chaperonin GroES (HSP10)
MNKISLLIVLSLFYLSNAFLSKASTSYIKSKFHFASGVAPVAVRIPTPANNRILVHQVVAIPNAATSGRLLVPTTVTNNNEVLHGRVANIGKLRKYKRLVIGQNIIFKQSQTTPPSVIREQGIDYLVVPEKDVLLAGSSSSSSSDSGALLSPDTAECMNGGILVKPMRVETQISELISVPSLLSSTDVLKGEVVLCRAAGGDTDPARLRKGDSVYYRRKVSNDNDNTDAVTPIYLDGQEYHHISHMHRAVVASVAAA